MRGARSVRLARALLAGALVCGLPSLAPAAPPGAQGSSARPIAGPSFVGYPTSRTASGPRFDFARLDGTPVPEVMRIAETVVGLAPLAQLQAINTRVNRVRARDDLVNYGVDDYWATPAEFFRNGGDCEDYAIAKYAVLERLGWPRERMWIVVLRETVISPIHAVLMVQYDGRLWTLDNLGDRVFVHGAIDYYRPSYSLNRFGIWWHGAPPQLAGALPGTPSAR
jgi:predicted transglutaminase-like cysteine proteinase